MEKKYVVDFVVKCSKDPKVREHYVKDPDGCMKKHGLTPEDRTVLKSGNVEKIKKYLGPEPPLGCFVVVVC